MFYLENMSDLCYFSGEKSLSAILQEKVLVLLRETDRLNQIISCHFMKIKCSHCSETTDVTLDSLIFENEDEKIFVSYLAAEMSNLPKREQTIEEKIRK